MAANHLGTSSTTRLHSAFGPLPPTTAFLHPKCFRSFFDTLCTGRLKQKQAPLLHGRKVQLKSKDGYKYRYRNTNIIRLLLSQPLRLPTPTAIVIICLSIAARTRSLVPGKVCDSGRGKLQRRTHLLRPNTLSPGSQFYLGQCKAKKRASAFQ